MCKLYDIDLTKYDLSIPSIDELRKVYPLEENILDDNKKASLLLIKIYLLIERFKFQLLNKSTIKVTLDDLTVLFIEDDTASDKGEYNNITKTIKIFVDELTLNNLETTQVKNILKHELIHYLNYKKLKNSDAYENDKDYYKSEKEFEALVVYFLSEIEDAAKTHSLPIEFPENRKDYPKFIIEKMLPNIKKGAIKPMDKFVNSLDDNHLKKFYKMTAQYFAESIDKGYGLAYKLHLKEAFKDLILN